MAWEGDAFRQELGRDDGFLLVQCKGGLWVIVYCFIWKKQPSILHACLPVPFVYSFILCLIKGKESANAAEPCDYHHSKSKYRRERRPCVNKLSKIRKNKRGFQLVGWGCDKEGTVRVDSIIVHVHLGFESFAFKLSTLVWVGGRAQGVGKVNLILKMRMVNYG